MRFFSSVGAVLLPAASLVGAIQLNPDDQASIREVTKEYAYTLMSYYKNNASDLPTEEIGIFPRPHYWWQAGAVWGALAEYSQFTGDASYVSTIAKALVANYGPNNDILLPWRKDQQGNDDQAFWGLAVMSAAEYDFPDPEGAPASYLKVAENCFNNIVSRWNTESCGGGLKWQIYPENDYGYTYKNAISNGATFALGARLARYTGNQTYADWATKIFDWSQEVGMISDKYEVYDGAGDENDCKEFDHTEWTYNIGMYLHGSSVMYNFTNGDETWKKHTSGLVDHSASFFGPYKNATDIMYEVACETGETGRHCNLDQQSFKAYISRSLGKTALMAPFTRQRITNWLQTSATAAAKSCTGGATGKECGSKWYTGGWDGTSGIGQQQSALEVTQALLMLKEGIVPTKKSESKPEPEPEPVLSSPAAPVASSTTGLDKPSSHPAPAPEITSAAPPQVPAPSSAAVTSSTVEVAPEPSSPVTIASSAIVPGGVPVNTPAASGVCTCKPKSTVTVYVPPVPTTASPVVPTPPTLPPNGTIPAPPAANTTGPEEFLGAAANSKATTLSVLGAAALVIVSALM